MPKFCKDCAHSVAAMCNRPVDLGTNLVTGEEETRVIGWDCAYERMGGTAQVFGKDVPLCGPDAQFFQDRPADYQPPGPAPNVDMTPATDPRIQAIRETGKV